MNQDTRPHLPEQLDSQHGRYWRLRDSMPPLKLADAEVALTPSAAFAAVFDYLPLVQVLQLRSCSKHLRTTVEEACVDRQLDRWVRRVMAHRSSLAMGTATAATSPRVLSLFVELPPNEVDFDRRVAALLRLLRPNGTTAPQLAALVSAVLESPWPGVALLPLGTQGMSGLLRQWCSAGGCLLTLPPEVLRSVVDDALSVLSCGDLLTISGSGHSTAVEHVQRVEEAVRQVLNSNVNRDVVEQCFRYASSRMLVRTLTGEAGALIAAPTEAIKHMEWRGDPPPCFSLSHCAAQSLESCFTHPNATLRTLHFAPPSLESLTCCFLNCQSLTSIDLSECTSLTRIDRCFNTLRSVRRITLPSRVSSIDDSFNTNSVLQEVTVAHRGTVDRSSSSVSRMLRRSFQMAAPDVFQLPPLITELSEVTFDVVRLDLGESHLVECFNKCFVACSRLSAVVLPPNTRRIENSFNLCGALTTVEVGRLVVAKVSPRPFIGHAASVVLGSFNFCATLARVVVPPRVVSVVGSFCCLDALRDVSWGETDGPDGVPSALSVIDASFANCNALRSVVVPPLVMDVRSGAFAQCEALEQLDLRRCTSPALSVCDVGAKVLLPAPPKLNFTNPRRA